MRYRANPDYFAGKPAVDPLIYAITPDANVRLQKLKRGECQVALSPKPLDITEAGKDGNLKTASVPAFMTAFVAINSQHPPLDKSEVRQAINLAFDKPAYLKAVFEGTAIAANGPYPPNTRSYAKDLPGYAMDLKKPRHCWPRQGLRTVLPRRSGPAPQAACSIKPEPGRTDAPGGSCEDRYQGRDPRDRMGRADPPGQGWRA